MDENKEGDSMLDPGPSDDQTGQDSDALIENPFLEPDMDLTPKSEATENPQENPETSEKTPEEDAKSEEKGDATFGEQIVTNAEPSMDESKPDENDGQKESEIADEPMDVEENVDKTLENIDANSAVCQLEEELKRLHGGEPEVEQKQEKGENNELTLESLLEDGIEAKKNDEKKTENIMKDSDLEKMLSADDVINDATLLKKSQDEFKTMDVIVCGRCNQIYHHIDEFKTHKSQSCETKLTVANECDQDQPHQIWGFILWKNAFKKTIRSDEKPMLSWLVYQNWCKLTDDEKNTWISAGKRLQFCHKIGNAKVDIKIKKDIDESNKENSIDNSLMKVTRSVRVYDKANDPQLNKALRTHSLESREYAVERIVAKRFNPKKKIWEYQIKWEHFSNEENTWEPVTNLTHCKKMVEEFEEQLKRLKSEKAKQQQTPLETSTPIIKKKIAIPSSSTSNLDISSGRPERRSKQKALNQVKAWCGNISDDESNGGLKRKLDDDSDDSFEKKLKLDEYSDDSDDPKSSSQKLPSYRKIAPKPTPVQILRNGVDKTNVLPQNVLIPDANGVVRINQKQLPSLSTGVYIMSKTAGIIKLDSATSKVATSGGGQTIVKVAPKIGQTQIKIVTKDGSTTKQLVQTTTKPTSTTTAPTKIYKPIITKVKKPDDKKSLDSSKKVDIIRKSTEIGHRGVKVPPGVTMKPVPLITKPKEPVKLHFSDEDDNDSEDAGLDDLPFPEDIKLPEPDSPQEFSLDPATGKLAGVEYPNVPDPEPLPEPEHAEESKSDISLDNIVKLAAADITEEDLKNEPGDEDTGNVHEEKKPIQHQQLVMKSAQVQPKTIVRMPMGISQYRSKTPTTATSILNKVLTGTPIIRRATTAPSTVPRTQQRILNQSVARSPITSVVRVGNTTYVRKTVPKTRTVIPGGTKIIKAQHEQPATGKVYTYARPLVQTVARKIGNTTIKSSNSPSTQLVQQQSPIKSLIASRPVQTSQQGMLIRSQPKLVQTGSGIQQKILGTTQRKEGMVRQQAVEKKVVVSKGVGQQPVKSGMVVTNPKPKQVISMPSLLDDEESEPSLQLLAKVSASDQDPLATTSTAATEQVQTLTTQQATSDAQQSEDAEANVSGQTTAPVTDLSSFTLADNDNPIFITGDDGTVYQVAGQNEQGQTILLTQGTDGQQQCLLVTSETAESMEQTLSEEQQHQQQQAVQQQATIAMSDISENVTEPLSVKTDTETNDQVVAQVVRAEPPSPGGTHKVVVMLPDGNLMVTQVSPEEYASLELD